ncbi:MAG: cytochrome c biogenesis protein CcsA [Luteolibacter sp.]
MDRYLLIVSTLLAAVGAVFGMMSVHHGIRSRWTVLWMLASFCCQLSFLGLRGEARGACPLRDLGEILAFLAWSLTMFYFVVGPPYRLSLLGVFTAPVVVVFQSVALWPGVLTELSAVKRLSGNPWGETHAAMSVLSYGALALAGVAGVMFLVLDRQLKEHHLKSGLFRNLPPVRELLDSMVRLLWLGTVLLTIGIVAGFIMPHSGGYGHFAAAVVTWIGYCLLLGIKVVRGMTGRRFSLSAVGMFLVSLTVFAFV